MVVLLLAATLIVPPFISRTVDQDRSVLTAYNGTTFTGAAEHLEETREACRSFALAAPVRSVRNDSALIHVTLFADTTCTKAVSVVSGGESDSGLVPSDSQMVMRGESRPTLLGQEGAQSYRTAAP